MNKYQPLKRALLIGIDYVNMPNQLYGCSNDINRIRNHLLTKCNYSPLNIKIMSDNTFKPTALNIKNTINWFISGLKSGDTLFFHYSGHGTSILDKNKDELDGRDEAIVPLDYSSNGIISDDWILTNFIQRIPTGVTLYAFFDCCCSGTMTDIKYNIKHIVQSKIPITKPIMSYIPNNWHNNFLMSIEGNANVLGNVFVFSGCLDNEFAAESVNIEGQAQGAFTMTLIDTLIANNNRIKIIDLNKELNCRLNFNGYKNQRSLLSISKLDMLDHTINL